MIKGIKTNSKIKPVDTIQKVIATETGLTFQKYCQNISRQFENEKTPVSKNEWADEFIIMFMPDIIKLPVCILTFENDTLQLWQKFEGMNNIQRGKEPVYLLYDKAMGHYDMLLPQEEGDSLAGDVSSGVNRAAIAQDQRPQNESPIPPSLMNKEQLMQMIVNKSPPEAKRILGERLYPLIHMKQPNLAGKITGMLLGGLDNSELVTLINDEAAMQSNIAEALAALQAHEEEQEALAALAPDEPLAELKKTLDEIRLLHTKYKDRDFLQYQNNTGLQQIMYEW